MGSLLDAGSLRLMEMQLRLFALPISQIARNNLASRRQQRALMSHPVLVKVLTGTRGVWPARKLSRSQRQ